eukprot:scaffold985_cov164-Isochrysis_galbana.AAC.1
MERVPSASRRNRGLMVWVREYKEWARASSKGGSSGIGLGVRTIQRIYVFVAEPASGGLVGKPIIGANSSVCDVLEVEVIIPRGAVSFPTPPCMGGERPCVSSTRVTRERGWRGRVPTSLQSSEQLVDEDNRGHHNPPGGPEGIRCPW